MSAFRIQDIQVDDTHLTLALVNGQQFCLPLTRYVRLHKATAAQRLQWQLVDGGHGIAWPALCARDDAALLNSFDLVWDDLCDKALSVLAATGHQLDQMAPCEREVVALWRLQADGYNGGFLQFFCNWGEEHCQLAMQALQTIGATATHEIVSRQRAMLDRLESSPDPIEPWDIPRLLTATELKEVSEVLDLRLWESAREIAPLAVRHYASQG